MTDVRPMARTAATYAATNRRILRPREKVLWHVGHAPPPHEGLHLDLGAGGVDHKPFSSVLSIMEALEPGVRPATRQTLRAGMAALRAVAAREASDYASGEDTSSDSAVAFAVLRRISRESAHMAEPIDRAARAVAAALGEIGRPVWISGAEHADRGSLKIVCRMLLYFQRDHRLPAQWHWRSDPLARAQGAQPGYVASRLGLFHNLAEVLEPSVARCGTVDTLAEPNAYRAREAIDLSGDVVLQNYDAVFLKHDPRGAPADAENADVYRMLGVAAVNVGQIDLALSHLETGERAATSAEKRAQLCYLQSLVHGKRRYDAQASGRCLDRGLAALAHYADDLPVAARLEKSWLLNGVALNAALEWRRGGEEAQLHRAGGKLEEAFWLIDGLDDAPFVYLRHNLLANVAFLTEMSGDFAKAIDVFANSFVGDDDPLEWQPGASKTTFCYRLGVLHLRNGDAAKAMALLTSAEASAAQTGTPFARERVLRALAAAATASSHGVEAEACLNKGRELACDLWSAEGAREHGVGLWHMHRGRGSWREADRVLDFLIESDLISADGEGEPPRMRPPSPKLPAYFPEVDLEDVPNIDLNRLLSLGETVPR